MATGGQAEPILDYVITVHAALEMKRRGLSEDMIQSVLAAPGQRWGAGRAGCPRWIVALPKWSPSIGPPRWKYWRQP